jgi:hypothetical protein
MSGKSPAQDMLEQRVSPHRGETDVTIGADDR